MKRYIPILLILCLLAGCAERAGHGPAPTETPVAEPIPVAEAISTPGWRDLTEEEVEQVNQAFSYWAQDWKEGTSEYQRVSGFFASYYADVRELDFVGFLRYFPEDGAPGNWDQGDEREAAALSSLMDHIAVDSPTHSIHRSSVDATLKKYAGITTEDLVDTSGLYYLPEYDSWYTFTSDFDPTSFTCAGGRMTGDTAVLWSEKDACAGGWDELTLKKEGDSWYIRSFLRVPIDRAAYEKYRDFVEDHYDRDMEERNRRAKMEGGWSTSGWELVYFQKEGENADLGLEVYRMEKVNTVDPPEMAPQCIAGGAWVDSQLRIHGWDWKCTYLGVVDGEPVGVFYLPEELDMSRYVTRQEFLDMVAENGTAGG